MPNTYWQITKENCVECCGHKGCCFICNGINNTCLYENLMEFHSSCDPLAARYDSIYFLYLALWTIFQIKKYFRFLHLYAVINCNNWKLQYYFTVFIIFLFFYIKVYRPNYCWPRLGFLGRYYVVNPWQTDIQTGIAQYTEVVTDRHHIVFTLHLHSSAHLCCICWLNSASHHSL